MRFFLLTISLFITVSFAEDSRNFCAAIKKCLDYVPTNCSEESLKPNKKIKYDSDFCAPFQELKNRGLSPEEPVGRIVFSELASEYRVIYESKGEFFATKGMISFLFDNMPFTAKLINAYQDASYELHYTKKDQTAFSGTNGRSLSGDFVWALQDSANTNKGFRNVFLGYGRAKVLRWSLHGTAVAFLDMDPVSNDKIRYRLRAVVFPGNSILNSIMQMNVFKHVVAEKLDHIVKDVVNSANQFAKGNEKPIQKIFDSNNPKDIQDLKLFREVVKGKSWTLGDAVKKEQHHGK